jgi:ATP-dependent Clp protease protease subunit
MGRPTVMAQVSSSSSGDDEGPSASLVALAGARTVFLHGEVTEQLILGVIASIIQLANVSSDPIYLVVSTYGGSADEMFSLYDTIKFLRAPVYTVGLGKIMSAGVLLLAAGVKGRRLIGASARIMIHSVSSGAVGNIFELETETKETRRLQSLMEARLLKETKLTKLQLERMMLSSVNQYIVAEQAIAMGIADKVIGEK